MTTRPVANNHVTRSLFSLSNFNRFLFIQDPENDVKEVEKWLNVQSGATGGTATESNSGTSNAFDNFLEKRASTIPAEPVSEHEIQLDVDPPPNKYSIN